MHSFATALIFALAMCADCLAVSVCSSVTLKRIEWKNVTLTALVFAVVQSALLMVGWGIGDLCAGLLGRMAEWVGFALLVYVGGSMIISGLRRECGIRDLNGLGHILLGALATSMDALTVGASLSLAAEPLGPMLGRCAAVFVVTAISVVAGISCGHRIGHRFGKAAEVAGGVILLAIALTLLL